MADNLDLLFRIRGDATGAKAATDQARQAVHQLRNSATQDLKQIQNASTASLGNVSTTLGQVSQSIPVVGRFVSSLSSQFSSLTVAMEGTAIGAAGLAGPLGAAVIVIGVALAGVVALDKALFGLAVQAGDVEGKMFDLSQQTGVAVETLSALEVLAKTTGGSIENVAQSLTIFQVKLDEAQDSSSAAGEKFRQLGIEVTNTEDSFRQALKVLAAMPAGFHQTNEAAELFGRRGGKQVLAILKESQGDLDGTIDRLRELGVLISTDSARAADEFNDQLALLEFQVRAVGVAIGREVIPVILQGLQDLSVALNKNRDLIEAVATVAGALAALMIRDLKVAILAVELAWAQTKVQLQAIQAIYEAIAIAAQIITRNPIPPPPSTGTPPATTDTKTKTETTSGPSESRARQRLQAQLQAQKELLAAQITFFEQEKSLAADRLAQAEREFQLGQATRKDKLQAELEGNRAIRDADLEQLAHKRSLLLTEAALASDDLKKRTALESEITALDQKAADREAQSDREQKDLRAAARQQEREDLIAHQESLLELGAKFDAARIASIEAAVRAGTKAALEGDQEIAAIENTILDREQAFLVKKLAAAGVEPAERQKIAVEIAKIDADRTLLAQQQEDRRLAIVQRGTEAQKQTLTDSIDTLLQVEQIRAASLIASIQALAAARVKSEEDAAREITAIRVGLIDSEIEAIQAKLSATRSIADPVDRSRAQAELNNRIKVLEEERKAIQNQGERDREEGRQRDLDNERRYADELIRTKERIRDIERDAARAEIDLMIIHHARRRDILRARRAFDQADEEDRHRQALERIRIQEEENRESTRTQEEKDEHEAELNRLREAEAERHRLAMQGIKDKGKQDEKETDPIGRIGLDTEDLEDFASTIEDSIVPLGEILTRTFLQFADALGQVVSNWVLLGTTGPAVMRKLLAQALASIAAEAAVNAIKELALGFAMLFLNPAEAGAHFTAAALWGSIAGVAAVAGRGVAGDLFKQKDTDRDSGRDTPGQLNPLTLTRNAGPGAPQQFAPQITPVRVEITVSDSKFGNAITAHVVDDVNNAGPLREIIAGDGNLNRG